MMKKELRVVSARHHAEPLRRGERSFLSRYLDPIDIAAELLTGTILALSLTLGGSLIVGEGPDAARKMLLGVLGCNVAWGIIDGTTCLMSRMYELRRKARLHAAVHASVAGEDATAIVADELNEELAGFASPMELTQFYRHVAAHLSHLVPEPVRMAKEDFYRALITFGLMCATTLPAVLPFLLVRDLRIALRVANLLLLMVLFFTGYRWGRITRSRPWIFGLAVLLIGRVLVGVAMLLEP
jgi:hypothetical protein